MTYTTYSLYGSGRMVGKWPEWSRVKRDTLLLGLIIT